MDNSALHAVIEVFIVIWAVIASIGCVYLKSRAIYFESQYFNAQNARRRAEWGTQHCRHELDTLKAKIKRRARREDPDA